VIPLPVLLPPLLLLLLLLLQGCPKCLDEAQAVVRVIRPLLSALVYLHNQGIIHRWGSSSRCSSRCNSIR
jgi:hypothetical protein